MSHSNPLLAYGLPRRLRPALKYSCLLGLLMGLPFLLGLGASNPLALWLSVATGAAALALTILTDHQTGLIPVLPYSVHLAVDAAVGATFLAAPFLFGFAGLDALYYWLNGAAVAVGLDVESSVVAWSAEHAPSHRDATTITTDNVGTR